MNQKSMQEILNQQHAIEAPVIDTTIQVIGFIIGDEEFAVPILNVREIVKPVEYTRIPSTPHYVLGVFNLRGNILPLIDLRQKFRLEHKPFCEDTRILVMNHNDQIIGFVIDRLTEALHLKEEEIDHSIGQKDGRMIYGIGKKEDRLITILKSEELLKRDF